MQHELRRYANANDASFAAADFVAERARDAVAHHGHFAWAVSGGQSPWVMFETLATLEMPWENTTIYQVDERAATLASGERNLANLRASLSSIKTRVVAMPVEGNLEEDALAYEEALPARFDLVHLGLGPDGHTASLIPGDPVLDETTRLVSVTGSYQGVRRLTLTYPALARAEWLLWLVLGATTRDALAALLRDDPAIPASRVVAGGSTIFCDEAALG